MQSQLALGVSNMGKVINILLSSNNETEKTMLATLSDSGKILTDVFHKISLNRRGLITPQMNLSVRALANKSEIDKFLYGFNFGSQCKTQKDIEKYSPDILSQPSTSKTVQKNRAFSISGNWRSPFRPMKRGGRRRTYGQGSPMSHRKGKRNYPQNRNYLR